MVVSPSEEGDTILLHNAFYYSPVTSTTVLAMVENTL